MKYLLILAMLLLPSIVSGECLSKQTGTDIKLKRCFDLDGAYREYKYGALQFESSEPYQRIVTDLEDVQLLVFPSCFYIIKINGFYFSISPYYWNVVP